jgi:nucleotide-binding universal stress UspA family protein
MKTHKKVQVLIALDYDPTAQLVAESGFAMAKAMNADVVLLHVIAQPVYYSSLLYSPIMGYIGNMDQIQMDNNDDLKISLLNYLEKIKQHLGDEFIKIIIMEGDSADSILKMAIELHTDIIVMGSHSQKWLEKILLGSVTSKVLQLSTIPLFIIPTKKND